MTETTVTPWSAAGAVLVGSGAVVTTAHPESRAIANVASHVRSAASRWNRVTFKKHLLQQRAEGYLITCVIESEQ